MHVSFIHVEFSLQDSVVYSEQFFSPTFKTTENTQKYKFTNQYFNFYIW